MMLAHLVLVLAPGIASLKTQPSIWFGLLCTWQRRLNDNVNKHLRHRKQRKSAYNNNLEQLTAKRQFSRIAL
jgi:hypothetical protein